MIILPNFSSDQSSEKLHEPASADPFDHFITKLTPKDRANANKRATAMESDPPKLFLWRRMAVKLFSLAGHSAKLNAQESIQFYIADGKYRMQMWSLEDNKSGELTIHCRDVLDDILKKKLIGKPDPKTPNRYPVGDAGETLVIERVLPQAAEHPAAFRDLMSWGRKCMRIDLPVNASTKLLDIVDEILDLSRPVKK